MPRKRTKEMTVCFGLILFWLGLDTTSLVAQSADQIGPQEEHAINISSKRPLSDAVAKLWELFPVPMSFEEVPYQASTDLGSFTVRTKSGASFSRTVPRGGTIEASCRQNEGAKTCLETLLASYYNAGLAGTYSITERDKALYLLPETVKDRSGNLKKILPVMETKISFPAIERPVAITIDLIAEKLTAAAKVKVVVAMDPYRDDAVVTIGADDQSASDRLAKLGELTRPISYLLLYDTQDKTYYLSLAYVPLRFASTPAAPSSATVNSQGGSTNPFFVKAQ